MGSSKKHCCCNGHNDGGNNKPHKCETHTSTKVKQPKDDCHSKKKCW